MHVKLSAKKIVRSDFFFVSVTRYRGSETLYIQIVWMIEIVGFFDCWINWGIL